MKKIPCIFKIDHVNHCTTAIINPECQWVFDGEGVATRKYDGTCCLIQNGFFYKRRQVKKGHPKPETFIECETDPITGKTFGWVPVQLEDKWHWEVLESWYSQHNDSPPPPPGTYELCGPKINGNPEGFEHHQLISHADAEVFEHPGPPVDVSYPHQALGLWLLGKDIEGIVFKHPDGRMAKIRKTDFRQVR